MKKRFTGILMCLMMLCMSLLTGCSLVDVNYDKYYSQAVAVVEKNDGTKYEITKLDLINMYQSYGYIYEQYYGQTRKEALASTLTLLENQKIVIDEAEKKFGYKITGEGMTEKEKTYLYTQTFDTLKSRLKNYYDEIVGTTEGTEETLLQFTGYTKTAKYEDGVITRVNTTEKLLNSFTYSKARDFNKSEDYELIYENFVDLLLNKDYQQAYLDYCKNLRANEYGLSLSTSQKEIFQREIDRIYKSQYESYVSNKYTESITDDEATNVTPLQVANLYSSKVRAAYTQYIIEQDSTYDSTLTSSLDQMYYFKEGESDNKYFTVANVLFQFDETLQEEFNKYTNKYDPTIIDPSASGFVRDPAYTYGDYISDINGLYEKIKPIVRQYVKSSDSYEVIETNLTIENIYSEMKEELEAAQNNGSKTLIGDTINAYMYEYNQDPGMQNATNNYVIGVDSNGDLIENSFVSSFNEGAIELYDNGNAQLGDISGYVKTTYGIHVLIYTGACENLFEGINSTFALSEEGVQVLAETRVNPLVDKTYFDVMYDEIFSDNSSYIQELNLAGLKGNFKIYEYSSRYSDLLG